MVASADEHRLRPSPEQPDQISHLGGPLLQPLRGNDRANEAQARGCARKVNHSLAARLPDRLCAGPACAMSPGVQFRNIDHHPDPTAPAL